MVVNARGGTRVKRISRERLSLLLIKEIHVCTYLKALKRFEKVNETLMYVRAMK